MSSASQARGETHRPRAAAGRFLYVCGDPGIPIPGRKGASLHVESVCREFSRLGLEGSIRCVRPEGPGLEGYRVHGVGIPRRRRRKSIQERESRLVLASFEPETWGTDRPDFVYERYSMWHFGGLVAARHWDVPLVLEVNSPLPDEALTHRTLTNEPLARGIARLLFSEADLVICVSDEVAAWVRECRGSDSGVVVVPNGVDPEIFRPTGERHPELPDDVPLVSFCGSFRPWHGITDLLESFRLLVEKWNSDAHLVCVGDGPERRYFEAEAQSMGLRDRLHLAGQVPQDEVRHWIGASDVAVVPYSASQEFYFSPLKLYEFLALGLPVVATDVGQMRDVVRPEFGRLAPAGSPESLAQHLAEILSDAASAQAMGQAGRDWVLEQATWEVRVAQILREVEGVR